MFVVLVNDGGDEEEQRRFVGWCRKQSRGAAEFGLIFFPSVFPFFPFFFSSFTWFFLTWVSNFISSFLYLCFPSSRRGAALRAVDWPCLLCQVVWFVGSVQVGRVPSGRNDERFDRQEEKDPAPWKTSSQPDIHGRRHTFVQGRRREEAAAFRAVGREIKTFEFSERASANSPRIWQRNGSTARMAVSDSSGRAH
jgi:hypothetical protein